MSNTPYNNTSIKPSDIQMSDLVRVIKNGTQYESRFRNVVDFIEENANFATPELVMALSLVMGKGILIPDYTFDASAKTVTFDSFADIDIKRVLLITNVTDNIIIYNFADATIGGTAATNVLTLDYDTTTMSDSDELQVYYDMGSLVQRIDEASATITYIGYAQDGSSIADAVWSIKRIDTSSGTTIEWADGNNNFDNVWDNRAALTYN
jgi:hypothetical protein